MAIEISELDPQLFAIMGSDGGLWSASSGIYEDKGEAVDQCNALNAMPRESAIGHGWRVVRLVAVAED